MSILGSDRIFPASENKNSNFRKPAMLSELNLTSRRTCPIKSNPPPAPTKTFNFRALSEHLPRFVPALKKLMNKAKFLSPDVTLCWAVSRWLCREEELQQEIEKPTQLAPLTGNQENARTAAKFLP